MTDRRLTEAIKKTVAYSQRWTCKNCRVLLPPTYQVDHVIPHAVLSDDSFGNLQALCPNCHSKKTQREHMRIIRYKKKRALEKHQLCWFCLEKVDDYMTCSCAKILRDITFDSKKISLISGFDQFCHIDGGSSSVNHVLSIILERNKVMVNDREFYFHTEYDLKEIAACVFSATRTKRCSKLFSEVEINIDFKEEPEDTEGLVEFLETNLHRKLPSRIFTSPKVKYTYLIE